VGKPSYFALRDVVNIFSVFRRQIPIVVTAICTYEYYKFFMAKDADKARAGREEA
jgi:hypothetical protein